MVRKNLREFIKTTKDMEMEQNTMLMGILEQRDSGKVMTSLVIVLLIMKMVKLNFKEILKRDLCRVKVKNFGIMESSSMKEIGRMGSMRGRELCMIRWVMFCVGESSLRDSLTDMESLIIEMEKFCMRESLTMVRQWE